MLKRCGKNREWGTREVRGMRGVTTNLVIVDEIRGWAGPGLAGGEDGVSEVSLGTALLLGLRTRVTAGTTGTGTSARTATRSTSHAISGEDLRAFSGSAPAVVPRAGSRERGPTCRATWTFAGSSGTSSWTARVTTADAHLPGREPSSGGTFRAVPSVGESRSGDPGRDELVCGTRDREPRTWERERASRTGEHDGTDARWERG